VCHEDLMSEVGGRVKAGDLGDGLTHRQAAIAKLRLPLPPMTWGDLALALLLMALRLDLPAIPCYPSPKKQSKRVNAPNASPCEH